jgi:hypothetical protein
LFKTAALAYSPCPKLQRVALPARAPGSLHCHPQEPSGASVDDDAVRRTVGHSGEPDLMLAVERLVEHCLAPVFQTGQKVEATDALLL